MSDSSFMERFNELKDSLRSVLDELQPIKQDAEEIAAFATARGSMLDGTPEVARRTIMKLDTIISTAREHAKVLSGIPELSGLSTEIADTADSIRTTYVELLEKHGHSL